MFLAILPTRDSETDAENIDVQVPSNVFLKRLRPSIWLSFLMLCWGIMMVDMLAFLSFLKTRSPVCRLYRAWYTTTGACSVRDIFALRRHSPAYADEPTVSRNALDVGSVRSRPVSRSELLSLMVISTALLCRSMSLKKRLQLVQTLRVRTPRCRVLLRSYGKLALYSYGSNMILTKFTNHRSAVRAICCSRYVRG